MEILINAKAYLTKEQKKKLLDFISTEVENFLDNSLDIDNNGVCANEVQERHFTGYENVDTLRSGF